MGHNYIVCMYDDHYEIVGPFANMDDLSDYGDRWQAANDDRPTWQSIYLADPGVPPTVITPAVTDAADAA